MMSWINTLRTSTEDLGTLAENEPLTGYEPNDHFITEAYVEHTQASSGSLMTSTTMTPPSARRSLTRAEDQPITLKKKASRPVCRRRSVMIERRDPLFAHLCRAPKKLRDITLKANRVGLSWSDKGSRSSLNVKQRFEHEFQADYDRRSIQNLNEVIESQRGEIYRAHQGDERRRQDHQLIHEQLLEQNRELREAHEKSLSEMKELKRFQGSTFDTITRRLIEDRDTILELTGKIQELQNQINCMINSRDFQDAESVRSGHSHVTSQLVSFPPHPDPGGVLSRSLGMPSRNSGPPSIWDTHGTSGNVFENPAASSSAPCPKELNPWSSGRAEPIHSSTVEKSENQTPAQDQSCQSGPSARNSVVPGEGGFSKNYGADQQRLQISDLRFDKFPTPATFACWKIRFKTEVCTCSQFRTEAVLWIKEVEMVVSVDDLKSSCSVRGIRMPDFEELDARIASALNKIIHNSHFKRRVSLEEQKNQKQDRFLRGRQIAYLIYDHFRVTGIHDSVENYTDLFTIGLRNDDIQQFDSKWDGILLSMTKIPHDDILEGLYKIRIRESDKLKTVLELYDLEIHQKKSGPDYHRLKTTVKRSIEQDIRNLRVLV